MAIITLLTDFGIQDEYVGVVKGVVLNINPSVTLVDITHGIAAQDVVGAAYTLAAAFAYFPKGSIHLVIVDPGVGSDRQIIGARMNGHIFLAPNNGVLSMVFEQHHIDQIVHVSNERYFLQPVSHTFHGRDIFAPAAGLLSLGTELEALGPYLPENRIVRLDTSPPKEDVQGRLKGKIIAVDRYGNLITNIQQRHIEPMLFNKRKTMLVIEAGDQCISGLSSNYAHVPKGESIAIMGSRSCLEIAVRDGNAADTLKLERGDVVWVYIDSEEAFK